MYTNDIFNDMLRLRTLFDGFFEEKPGYETSREFPPVQIKEEDDRITIRALIPGIKAEDIDVLDHLAGQKQVAFEVDPAHCLQGWNPVHFDAAAGAAYPNGLTLRCVTPQDGIAVSRDET